MPRLPKKAIEAAVKAAKGSSTGLVRDTHRVVHGGRAKPVTTGLIRDTHRPAHGGPAAAAPAKATKKGALAFIGRHKKGAAVVGGLGLLSAAGAFGQPNENTYGSKTLTKASKPDTAMSNRYANAAKKQSTSAPSSSPSSSRAAGLSASGRSYTASKGDSLWSIAEKTAPKGTSVSSWWLAIKKMNTKDGKLRRLYTGTGVSLPPGARRS